MNALPLDLSERRGPVLSIEAGDLASSVPRHAALWLPAIVFSALGALALLAILSSQAATLSREGIFELFRGVVAEPANEQEEVVATPHSKPAPTSSTFSNSDITALSGKYCFAYMPGGSDPVAREAFVRVLWDKLDQQLQTLIKDRLEVCTPFEPVSPGVVAAGGCQKSACGVEDVTFYIDKDGKAAVDYRVGGRCESASEDIFSEKELLCRR